MRSVFLLLLLSMGCGAVLAQPSANFSATPTTGCPPMVVSFTDRSTGSPSSWSWTFTGASPSSSTLQNPTVSYSTPGTYTVSLTVSNASGNNTMTKTGYITVKTPPTVSFTASPTTVCPGGTVSFSSSVTWNATGTSIYIWDFGDGGTDNRANPTHTYAAGGPYTVKLTATNGAGCPTTDTQANMITVHQPPVVSFTASDTAICSVGGSTTFTGSASGTGSFSYKWNFGDGSPAGTSNPVSHSYSSLGPYTVSLAVTDGNGCTDSGRKVNYIRVRSVTASAVVPATACAATSVPVSSTAATTAGANLNWDFGDGSALVSGATATHFYSSSGTFTVRLIAAIGGCSDTASNTIIINPRPNTNFSFSPALPCPAPVSVSFTAASITGTASWNFGDGFTGSGLSTSHVYTWDTFFAVKLTMTSPAGCQDSYTDTVKIYPAQFNIINRDHILNRTTEGCFPLLANLQDTLYQPTPGCIYCPAYPSPIVSRTWNLGDGSAAYYGARPTHTYTNPGTYYCTLTSTTANGCTFNDTLDVHVGGHSMVNFFALPIPVCAGSDITFYDSSFSNYGPITSWHWDFGDGSFGVGNPIVNSYKRPGVYSITLDVSQNGCRDTLKKTNYVTVLDPAAIPIFHVDCSTLGLVHFIDSSIGATSVKWYFGDGTTSTTNNPNHIYPGAGTYLGSLVAWNSNTGCRDSVNFTVVIHNLSLALSATDSTICIGDTLRLIPIITGSGSTGSPVGAEIWNWNQGTTPPTCCVWPSGVIPPNDLFVARTRGRFNVVYSARDDNGCLYTKTEMNFITVGGPIAHFKTTPPFGCAPALITLTDTSTYAPGTTAGSVYWDFGDGTSATTPNAAINHYYPNIGSYAITIKVKDNIGCTDSLGITNYLTISRPHASFATLGSAACAGTPYTFYSSSTGNSISHSWDFGDGTTSNASSPSHTYSSPGTYSVRLIVTDGLGCKDTAYKTSGLIVSPRPTAGFTMDDTINVCPPLIVNFTNTSVNAVSYNWNFANGTSSVLTNPTATYSSSGIFSIRLIATNSVGCTDTAYGRARVLGYNGVLSYSPLKGCAPLTVHFQANNVPGVAGFIYDFGDGTTASTTAASLTHTYTQAGPHVPKITMTDNLGCSATSWGIDTIKVDGIIAGFTFTPFPACDKGTIQFRDTSKGAYSQLNPVIWKFHDGTTSNLPTPSKTYPGPGRYPVTLYGSTVTGCIDTFTRDVVFHKLPTISAGADTTICITDSAILRPRGGVSYVWSPAGSLSCTNCTNPRAFPTVPTSYAVIGTDTNGCTNKDTVAVSLRYKTITTVVGGGEICSGDTMQFIAVGASTYQWTPPNGLSDPTSDKPLAYPMLTQHYILISRYAGCIPDTDYVDLIVHPTPTVEAGENQTMIAGNTLHLEALATGIITQWLWSPSEGLWSPTQPSTDAMPKHTTLYTIKVSTEFGCIATDTVRIVVLCDNSQVYLPNTFTPDNNGVNDVFYPRGKGIANIDHFRIYDRWGEVVFERSNIAVDDKNNGWDGRKGGRELTPDIYVYTVEATCDTGEPIKWQGDVMLLR